jgi:hypothetical protein
VVHFSCTRFLISLGRKSLLMKLYFPEMRIPEDMFLLPLFVISLRKKSLPNKINSPIASAAKPMRPKARLTTQHERPPGWLEKNDRRARFV